MLKSLDILIGLSVIMLIVSMAVTLVNQAILNAIAARGQCLQKGLADLLQHLDWAMPRQTAEDIAAMVLTQPSVRKKKIGPLFSSLFPSQQFGEVIHREELTKILLSFGPREAELKEALGALRTAIANNTKGAAQQQVSDAVSALTCAVKSIDGVKSDVIHEIVKTLEEINQTADQAKQNITLNKVVEPLSAILVPLGKIIAAMKTNGISEPGKTLDNVRMMALQLEKSNPEQANDVRHSTALLQEASSPFLAKINFAFDQTMDRVTTRYTAKARMVTFVSAAVIALSLQLDTVYIFNRLSMDDKMRDALVSQAAKVVADEEVKKIAENQGASTGGTAPVPAAPAPAGTASDNATAKQPQPEKLSPQQQAELRTNYYLNFLAQQGIIKIAPDPEAWWKQWNTVSPAGVLLSILLLSLGAPFWYKALGKLLQLRSILAQKDDDQRVTRQTTQAPQPLPNPATPQSSPQAALGERGNLGVAG